MSSIRAIKQVSASRATLEGAGVHLKRAFGFQQAPNLDPFLLLDDFHSDNPDHYLNGFPWHPHRGIETITYMLHGEVEHGDSMGNKGVIRSGDVQWMTAGSGIIHQEMPKGREDGLMWGFQLWANLPASHKMMEPRYREVKSEEIPVHLFKSGSKVRIIAGEIDGVKGPVQDIVTEPEYLDVSMPSGADFTHAIPTGNTVFAYVIEGAGYFEPRKDPYAYEMVGSNYFDFERGSAIGPEHLVIYGDGGEISIRSEIEGVRFLLVSGRPIGEPVAWYGPIVMNTQQELKTAFEEYRNGTFLKHAK